MMIDVEVQIDLWEKVKEENEKRQKARVQIRIGIRMYVNWSITYAVVGHLLKYFFFSLQ